MKFFFTVMIFLGILLPQQIKSLITYSNNEDRFPVIVYNGEKPANKLFIEFDIAGKNRPSIYIQFLFCDKNWKPYENSILNPRIYNTDNNINPVKLPVTISGADYHFVKEYPDKEIKFNLSGKWKYEIRTTYKNELIGEGKFFVVKNASRMTPYIFAEDPDIKDARHFFTRRALAFSVKYNLPDSLQNFRVKDFEMIENRRIDDAVRVTKNTDEKYQSFETDGFNYFNFTVKNILPGNEYRQLDLSDPDEYSTKFENELFNGNDYINVMNKRNYDFDGFMKLNEYSETTSDYVNVILRLSPAKEINGKVFVTGSFCNWNILPENELKYTGEDYEVVLPLKRGKYDYQYVIQRPDDGQYDWYQLEGNFLNTKNTYYMFLFYEDPDNFGYDRIIAYTKIKS